MQFVLLSLPTNGFKEKSGFLETKVAIIHSAEKGKKKVNLSNKHSLPKSTVATVIANKDKVLKAFEENKMKPEKKKIRGFSFQDVEDARSTDEKPQNFPVS